MPDPSRPSRDGGRAGNASPAAVGGPREVKGLVAPLLGKIFASPYRSVVRGLVAARVSPDHLTVLSVATNIAIGVMLVAGWRFVPGVLLIPAGLFDIFDGGVARARGKASPRGAWLDSTGDRIAEAVVLGALFLSLSDQGRDVEAALAVAALSVSLLVSYTRAQSHALGADLGEGLFARLERAVALIIGLVVPGALVYALVALVGLGAVTLVQRILQARGRLGAVDRPQAGPPA